jgi:putative inorganic carbon (HCO3(-)) transporter
LGLAAFRFTALWADDEARFVGMLIIFFLVGLGILVIGLLGADWGNKIPLLQQVLDRIPRLTAQLPDAPDAGISPNQLAGALILYLPLAALGVVAWRPGRRLVPLWLLALTGLAILLGVLIMTQSRGGWLGGMAGLVALVALAGFSSVHRWARWGGLLILVVVLLLGIGGVFLLGGIQAVGETLYSKDSQSAVEETVGTISIEGRVEIWSRALYAIADFPFTGSGLGTFRQVTWLLYPLFGVPSGQDIAHAHNIFLQTALDLGLTGLVAYLALLGIAGTLCWQVARRGDKVWRSVALGLVAGLAALHIYGLTDAVALGSKPGLAFWVALGLIAALPSTMEQQESASP